MRSTMGEQQLSISTILENARDSFARSEVLTYTGDAAAPIRTATFAEVGNSSARLAGALRDLGVKQGDRVATLMWNNAEHAAAYFGIPAMGAVIHTLNLRLFPEQLRYIVNHAADSVIIVDASVAPLLQPHLEHLPTVKHVIVANGPTAAITAPASITVHAWDELLAAQSDEYPWAILDEREPAAACYTSGTTGNPKGVVYSHRSIYLHSMQVTSTTSMSLAESDTALVIVPMFHAMSWGLPYASLLVGANMLMPDRFLQPQPMLHMLDVVRPTFAAAVPTIWNGVLAALSQKPQDIAHLRSVVVGGSAAPPSMIEKFEREHGVPILHAWGMTETSPLGSVAVVPAHATTAEEAWPYKISQGRIPATVRARLVADDGTIVPKDGKSIGELQVKGPWITSSYFEPEGNVAPADKFDPAEGESDGWLRTGDVGSITPESYLNLVDRTKDIIKSGGEWISSVDLENDVMAHPGVAEAAVIAVPDPKWDERPLVVLVAADPANPVTPAQLREHLADKVAKWQLPDQWAFVEEITKTSVGKFDKKSLRQQHADGLLTVQIVEAVAQG